MNARLILGVALLVAGAAVLGYDHYSHTTAGEILPFGPLAGDTDRTHAASLPPVIGSVAYRRAPVFGVGSKQD